MGDSENDIRFHLDDPEQTTLIKIASNGHLRLSDAKKSEWYRIDRLEGPEVECRRLLDLGFTPDEQVAVVRSTPLGDPLVVVVRGTQLALRKREASWIWVQ
jgi:ferrous iron transport protein A